MAKSRAACPKGGFKVILLSYANLQLKLKIETNICTPVLLNLLNLLRKRDKMQDTPCILSLFPNLFNIYTLFSENPNGRVTLWCFLVDNISMETLGGPNSIADASPRHIY